MVFIAGNYRPTKADIGRTVAALEAKLEQFPGEADLADGETWLYNDGIAQRRRVECGSRAATCSSR